MDLRSHCWLLGKPWEPEVRDKENFFGMVFYRKCRTLLLRQVQFSRSVMSDSATPWTAACQASLSITNSQSLLRLMPIESVIKTVGSVFKYQNFPRQMPVSGVRNLPQFIKR